MAPEDDDAPDWGGALQSAIADAGDGEEDDVEKLNVMAGSGLSASGGGDGEEKELPYVVLLNAAVAMVQTGEITVDEYIEGIKKLDAIADNALKIYAIPAVKKDVPGKLTEYQNQILFGLEDQLHVLKEGIGLLLTWPESQAIDDLLTGQQKAVGSLNAMAEIRRKADQERADILQREKEEKARRAQKAADADAADEEDADEDTDPVA